MVHWALLDDLAAVMPAPPSAELRQAARRLTRLYIPTRYPDAAGEAPADLYGEEDVAQAATDVAILMAPAERLLVDDRTSHD